MFPVLHMTSFRRKYLQLWEPSFSSDPPFEATLYLVFALGCVNSARVEPSVTLKTAQNFYEQARKIMPLDSLDIPSLEVVQYLLLLGNYLSFTRYSHRYCNTLAVAIQVAQTLGLHLEQNSLSANQLRREMGRRVWHLCLAMQRLVCL
jgi:hypothetical protein